MILFSIWSPPLSLYAADSSTPDQGNATARHSDIKAEWGGHLKLFGSASRYDDDTLFGMTGDNPFYDGNADVRLKNKLSLSKTCIVETHYEAVMSGGDTMKTQNEIRRAFPFLSSDIFFTVPINDDRRLFDLTDIIDENDGRILYHRLDRMNMTLNATQGSLCVGRQAQTWGNGFLFNPMDLFNPFAPSDIDRDYKTGDDMASIQLNAVGIGDAQFLYVPRRDPVTHHLESDQSSLSGKAHFSAGTNEFDVMLAKHYQENAAGFGAVGYLGDSVIRMDIVWSSLKESTDRNGYVSFVVNIDYSWMWLEKNMYGFVEFYFNDLGTDDYPGVFSDTDIMERIERGEMFTLGRAYLCGHIQMELHPLVNAYVTVINNTHDPSGIIQPRVVWDMSQNVQLTAGANLFYGGHGTEFGGFDIPMTDISTAPPLRMYFWLTCFF